MESTGIESLFMDVLKDSCKKGVITTEYVEDAAAEEPERKEGCDFCCEREQPGGQLYPKHGYSFYAGYSKQIDVDAFCEEEIGQLDYCPRCGARMHKEGRP